MDMNPLVLFITVPFVLFVALLFFVARGQTESKDRPTSGTGDARLAGKPAVDAAATYRADLDAELLKRNNLQTRPQPVRRTAYDQRAEERRAEERRREDERRREENRRRASDDAILVTDPRHPLYHTIVAPADADRACDTHRGHKHQAPDCAPASSHTWDSDSYGGSSRSDSFGGSSYGGSSYGGSSYGGSSYGGSDSSSSSSSSFSSSD